MRRVVLGTSIVVAVAVAAVTAYTLIFQNSTPATEAYVCTETPAYPTLQYGYYEVALQALFQNPGMEHMVAWPSNPNQEQLTVRVDSEDARARAECELSRLGLPSSSYYIEVGKIVPD